GHARRAQRLRGGAAQVNRPTPMTAPAQTARRLKSRLRTAPSLPAETSGQAVPVHEGGLCAVASREFIRRATELRAVGGREFIRRVTELCAGDGREFIRRAASAVAVASVLGSLCGCTRWTKTEGRPTTVQPQSIRMWNDSRLKPLEQSPRPGEDS